MSYEITFSITALCPCCGKALPTSHYLTAGRPTGHPLDRDNPYERKDRRVFITPCQDCFECRERRLERELADMEARKDGAYEERNKVVAALAKLFPSGVARTAIEGWSEDWHGCVYIDLPTGQVSWHFHDSQAHLFAGLPPYTKPWDGHDTPEKYRRLAALSHGVTPSRAPERDYCTDPDNCQRCKAFAWDQHKHEHAGIPLSQVAAGVTGTFNDQAKDQK